MRRSVRGTSRRDGSPGDASPESIERRGRRTRDSDQGGIGSEACNPNGKTTASPRRVFEGWRLAWVREVEVGTGRQASHRFTEHAACAARRGEARCSTRGQG